MDKNNDIQKANRVGRPQPSVFPVYEYGWKQLCTYFPELLLISIICFFISMMGGFANFPLRLGLKIFPLIFIYPTIGFSFVYQFLLSGPIRYGVAYGFLRATRKEKLEIKDMFEVFNNYWNVVLANLLQSFIIMLGFFFFIVPGIILACKLAFVPYIVVDKKINAVDAIKESWEITDGYAWEVFLTGLLAIPVIIAGLMFMGVGVIFSILWIRAAFASLYFAVKKQKREVS